MLLFSLCLIFIAHKDAQAKVTAAQAQSSELDEQITERQSKADTLAAQVEGALSRDTHVTNCTHSTK